MDTGRIRSLIPVQSDHPESERSGASDDRHRASRRLYTNRIGTLHRAEVSSRSSGDTSMWCVGLTGSPIVETAKRYSHWLVRHIFLVNHERGPACGSNQSSCVAM